MLDSVELSGMVMGKNPRVRLAEDIFALESVCDGKLLLGAVGVVELVELVE